MIRALLMASLLGADIGSVQQGKGLTDGGTWSVNCTNCGSSGGSGTLDGGDVNVTQRPGTGQGGVVDGGFLDGIKGLVATEAHVVFDGGVVSIGGLVSTEAHVVFDGGSVTATVANFPTSLNPDGGFTLDVTGSTVKVINQQPNPWPLNPLLPRCNPVRRVGCQP